MPVKNTVEFDEWEAVEMFFDMVEGIGVQKAAHEQNPLNSRSLM
ncbi:hypothetical protein l11_10640 [Neisseria weaveri LMG 5135]|nr:hypothetical protein l11_10640 [Neisseria weaveri LMG 5135]